MRYCLLLLLLIPTFFCTGVRAQKMEYHLTAGAGVSGLRYDRPERPVLLLEGEMSRRISARFSWLAGVGVQHTNRRDETSVRFNCPPIINGLKINVFRGNEQYESRRTDLTFRLGAAYERGPFQLSLAAVPALRLYDKLRLTEIITFDRDGRPDQVREYAVRPGENYLRFPDGNDERTGRLAYDRAWQLRADAEISYRFGERFALGLRARRDLTPDVLRRYETQIVCGFAGCDAFEQQPQQLDWRGLQLLLTGRYRL